MSIYRGTYFSALGCDSTPRSGTDALMSYFLGAYRSRSAANLGTYACKRLGSGWSTHAERRATDLGTAPYGGVDSTWGWALANALRLNSAELGIQLLILGRRIWSCNFPDAGWRNYSGDYHGHIHAELTPGASRTLTAAKIQTIINGKGEKVPTAKENANATYERFSHEVPEGVWAERNGLFKVGTPIAPRVAMRQAWAYGKGSYANTLNIPSDVWNRVNPETGATYGAMIRGITARLDTLAAALEAIVPGVVDAIGAADRRVAASDVAALLEVRVRHDLEALAVAEAQDVTQEGEPTS